MRHYQDPTWLEIIPSFTLSRKIFCLQFFVGEVLNGDL